MLSRLVLRFQLLLLVSACLLVFYSVEAQTVNVCELTLDSSLEVTTDVRYGAASNGRFILTQGIVVEFMGQTPDFLELILRASSNYYFFPNDGTLSIPDGCRIASWGPPAPNYLPLEDVIHETGISAWHEAGYLGAGVRVGVLDVRYDEIDAFLANTTLTLQQFHLIQPLQELQAERVEASGTEAHHGTNVLEILTTIAPQAHYVIARAVNAVEFSASVDALIGQGVHIILHAGNIITSDPTPYHDAVHRATDAGILWVNSAGNIGAGYYPTRYQDAVRLPIHQFADPNREGLQSSLLVSIDPHRNARISLISEQDRFVFDAYGDCNLATSARLVEGTTHTATISSGDLLALLGDLTRAPSAFEQSTCTLAPDGIQDNELFVLVAGSGQESETGSLFELYVEGALPAEHDPDLRQSLDPVVLVPADLSEVLTVGAFDPATNRMAWYSGRSNSLQYYALNGNDVDYSSDELAKPDITSYGEILLPSGRRFFGTSAAAPITGGASILVFNYAMSTSSPLDVRRFLVEYGSTCLLDGQIGQQGRRLQLPSIPLDTLETPTICQQIDWDPDLSSRQVDNFVQPEFARVQTAEELQRSLAFSSQLMTQSELAMNSGRFDLALLLAVEAGHVADTDETKRGIFDLLEYEPRMVQMFHGHTAPVERAYVNKDRSILITNSANEAIAWNLQAGSINSLLTDWLSAYSRVFADSNLTYLAGVNCISTELACMDWQVTLWNFQTRQVIATYNFQGPVISLFFTNDGTSMYVYTEDKLAQISMTTRRIEATFAIPRQAVESLTVESDPAPTYVEPSDDNPRMSSNGAVIARYVRTEFDVAIQFWRIGTDTSFLVRAPRGLFDYTFDMSGSRLAVSANFDDIIIFNTYTGEVDAWLYASSIGQANRVGTLRFTPSNGRLLSGGETGVAIISDLDPSPTPMTLQPAIVEPISNMYIIGDNVEDLLIFYETGEFVLWDLSRTSRFFYSLPSRESTAISGLDSVFDITYVPEPDEHYNYTSPNGTIVVGQGELNSSLAIRDSAGRTIVNQLVRDDTFNMLTPLESFAFSGDGNWVRFFTGQLPQSSETTDVLLVNPSAWRALACIIANRQLSPDEWTAYLGDIPYRETCPNLPVLEVNWRLELDPHTRLLHSPSSRFVAGYSVTFGAGSGEYTLSNEVQGFLTCDEVVDLMFNPTAGSIYYLGNEFGSLNIPDYVLVRTRNPRDEYDAGWAFLSSTLLETCPMLNF